ncbi:ribosomal protein L20 [Bacteriovorax sp. BSW11_IV]|uniref:50S ribosomal protein L20 n=1 Tax=Bacteriovorax sp. BSW11_IV TaxID=1353529 RepID=UPI00038A3628|nr:50S ribosomal protein L20 [Bacteriovorax sp. BSW11_IV]EQC47794.1 ribosomal protein L20 [Bacteriovorax sp. BSW11_IV]
MSRVRRGFKARRRRNKVLKLAKGFHFDRRTKYKHTAETVKRALHYTYIGRRLLKRDMRKLWITRISAASKLVGTSYSKFMGTLKNKGCTLNRKMLSEIAARDFDGFKAIFEATK